MITFASIESYSSKEYTIGHFAFNIIIQEEWLISTF